MPFEVQIQPSGKRISVSKGENLFAALRNAGFPLASSCGGEGSCGLCRVVPLEGAIDPPTAHETGILISDGRRLRERLACQIQVGDNLRIQIPGDALIARPRLQLEGDPSRSHAFSGDDMVVEVYHLELPPPSLADTRSDLRRITDALSEVGHVGNVKADMNLLRKLPTILREENWRVSIFVCEREIVGVAAFDSRPVGIAIDLGTTKLALLLVDLMSGETLAATGAPNPQIGYGEDVISRIDYTLRHAEGARTMAEKVRETVNELLDELLSESKIIRDQVVDACIVGNTAMLHLLAGLPVRQLAKSPYVATHDRHLVIPARDLGLKLAAGASVFLPPSIGGFVGADHVAMILSGGIDQSSQVTLGIDIGTNTEIVLRKPGQHHLTAVSCPSGPALEGAHIGDGMRAAAGAIERVRLTSKGVELQTVDDDPPVGLCGSGIVDAVAELFRAGLINDRGRFQRSQPGVFVEANHAAFMLASSEQSGNGRDILITQRDVNEVQLAKGAIYAGIQILLEETETRPEEVTSVILAGAFGSFLNVDNALAIGLFPYLPNARYQQIGNAAIEGAKRLLVSSSARRQASAIAARTRYYELTSYPQFTRRFAYGMFLPGSRQSVSATEESARSEGLDIQAG